jgi:hypothetical protein
MRTCAVAVRRIRDVAVRPEKRYYLAPCQSRSMISPKCFSELFRSCFGRNVGGVVEFEQETAPYAIATTERIIKVTLSSSFNNRASAIRKCRVRKASLRRHVERGHSFARNNPTGPAPTIKISVSVATFCMILRLRRLIIARNGPR